VSEVFNIYCDESCHLIHDGQKIMVLGAVMCRASKTREIAARLRELKQEHGCRLPFEVKWTKVSAAKVSLYLALMDYFFDNDDLSFRALVVPDKSKLDHDAFEQTHDDFYYKMYFDMLKVLLDPTSQYNIYLDIKDSRSADKTRKLREVLSNSKYDFNRHIVRKMTTVRSEHVEQLQLADLLIGAVAYANRDLKGSTAKLQLVDRMKRRSHYSLKRTTLLRERKVNLFHWHPREATVAGE